MQEINKLLDTAMGHVDEMVAERKRMIAEREAHIATIDMLRRKLKAAGCDVAAFPVH
tara:strand:- start:60 stop:230 length:171 start_codon:yes stop_codon:yes gene_type:complete